jgi:hypothetical protein
MDQCCVQVGPLGQLLVFSGQSCYHVEQAARASVTEAAEWTQTRTQRDGQLPLHHPATIQIQNKHDLILVLLSFVAALASICLSEQKLGL